MNDELNEVPRLIVSLSSSLSQVLVTGAREDHSHGLAPDHLKLPQIRHSRIDYRLVHQSELASSV